MRRVGSDGAFMTRGILAKQMQKKRAEKMLAGGGAAMDKQEQAEDSDVDLDDVEMVDSQEDEGSSGEHSDEEEDSEEGDSDGNAEVRVGGNDMRMSLTLNLTEGGMGGGGASDISDISDLVLMNLMGRLRCNLVFVNQNTNKFSLSGAGAWWLLCFFWNDEKSVEKQRIKPLSDRRDEEHHDGKGITLLDNRTRSLRRNAISKTKVLACPVDPAGPQPALSAQYPRTFPRPRFINARLKKTPFVRPRPFPPCLRVAIVVGGVCVCVCVALAKERGMHGGVAG